MNLATIKDKTQVVKILADSFKNNPTFNFLIRDKARKEYYNEKIAEYAFDFALRRDGVYLSNSGKGAALYFKYNFMKKDIIDFLSMIVLVVNAFALRRIFTILKHNKMVECTRPSDGNYYYFWFFGVLQSEQPKRSGRELAYHLIKKARTEGADIYAETTLEKNKRVYERFGFEVYKEWFNPENQINVWFMRKLAV